MGFYNRYEAEGIKLYKDHDTSDEWQNIGFIYSNKESLQHIIRKYNCERDEISYIKYARLKNNLSKEDYNLIQAHAFVRFKPNLDINSRIKENSKWATLSQLRERFNIPEEIKRGKIINAFEKVNGLTKFDISRINGKFKYSFLYDIELFKLACTTYDETEDKPLGYTFKEEN